MYFLFNLVLLLAVALSVYGHLKLQYIPQGNKIGLKCSTSSWYSRLRSAMFTRDDKPIATVPSRGTYSVELDRLDVEFRSSYGTKTLIFTPVIADNNTIWACKKGSEVSNKFKLTVIVNNNCRFNTTISYNGSDDLSSTNFKSQKKEMTLTEGDDLQLQCTPRSTAANTTPFSYTWTFYSNNGEANIVENMSKYTESNISRMSRGTYMCVASRQRCKVSDVIDINILYSPSANVTVTYTQHDVAEITCTVMPGNPYNFTVYGIVHYIDDNWVRTLEMVVKNDTATVVLSNVTMLDTGLYVCYVSNGIRDITGKLNQTAEAYLHIQAPPYDVSKQTESVQATRGSRVRLSKTFLLDNVTLPNVTWYQQNESSDELNQLNVETNFRNITVLVDVYNTSINRTAVIISTNAKLKVGTRSTMVNVTLRTCNVFACTESLTYVTFDDIVDKDANTGGRPQDIQSYLPFILVGVGVFIIVMVLAVVIIVVKKRQNKNNGDSQSRKTTPDSVRYRNTTYVSQVSESHDNTVYLKTEDVDQAKQKPDNTGFIEILENELYISADAEFTDRNTVNTENMEILENELYISADAEFTDRNTVNTDNMEILENELYISADAEFTDRNTVNTENMEILENDLYISADAEYANLK